MNIKIQCVALIMVLVFLVFGCKLPSDNEKDTSDYESDNIGTLKYIPEGSYLRDDFTTNITEITKSFRMSEYEITRKQFNEIMGNDPSYNWNDNTSAPVQDVNWYHAIAFCNKLSEKEGFTPVYTVQGITDWSTITYNDIPSNDDVEADASIDDNWENAEMDLSADGYRLPTEAEWTWAAMGATEGSDYNGSGVYEDGIWKDFAGDDGTNSINDYAVYAETSDNDNDQIGDEASEVGTMKPNELGLYDMSGNIRELCWDWYDASYISGKITDYTGPQSGTYRVVRGGCWYDPASYCTVRNKLGSTPHSQNWGIGFRVIRN